MKNRVNLVLLVLFFLSLLLCAWAWLFELRLLLALPALPAFCLQLWLCRVTPSPMLRALPLALVLLFAAAGGLIWLTAKGWDSLLGIIMVIVSISPAVGCVLALAGFGCWRLYQKGDIRGIHQTKPM